MSSERQLEPVRKPINLFDIANWKPTRQPLPKAPWRKRVLGQVERLYVYLEKRWGLAPPTGRHFGGKMIVFTEVRRNLGYPVYSVTSKRGGFSVGTLEWSNQWHRPRFMAHPEAVFDQQCIAEIYAAMRDFAK